MRSDFYREAANWRIHARGLFLFLIVLTLSMLSSSCLEKDFAKLRPDIERRGRYLETAPFIKQGKSLCGPAALAGIFQFWGRPKDVGRIAKGVFLPKLKGTLPMDMERAAREEGFWVESSAGSLDRIKSSLRDNVPVICLLDIGIGLYRQPHYITAIGYDDIYSVIIMHDGMRPNRIMSYDAFERAWERGGRWMLVIKPRS